LCDVDTWGAIEWMPFKNGLAFERVGTGPPLVLVHGIGSHRQAWRPVVGKLAACREVIALDLPGHGGSDLSAIAAAEHPYTVESLKDAVRSFIEGLGLESPHVAGNSLGGAIALELARDGTVGSATAFSPLGFWTKLEEKYAVAMLRLARTGARRLRFAAPTLLDWRVTRGALLGLFFGRPSQLTSGDVRDAYGAFVESAAFDLMLPCTRRYRFHGCITPEVPITIAWGARDLLMPWYQSRGARRLLPRAKIIVMAGCGHVPMSDDPTFVAEVLLAGTRTT
jgi:pimeloyl-ACP methyl ester carboxylesterase